MCISTLCDASYGVRCSLICYALSNSHCVLCSVLASVSGVVPYAILVDTPV